MPFLQCSRKDTQIVCGFAGRIFQANKECVMMHIQMSKDALRQSLFLACCMIGFSRRLYVGGNDGLDWLKQNNPTDKSW